MLLCPLPAGATQWREATVGYVETASGGTNGMTRTESHVENSLCGGKKSVMRPHFCTCFVTRSTRVRRVKNTCNEGMSVFTRFVLVHTPGQFLAGSER